LSEVIDHVINKALDSVEKGVAVGGTDEKLIEKAVEAVGRKPHEQGEMGGTREVVP
jgi:hypothetical protein